MESNSFKSSQTGVLKDSKHPYPGLRSFTKDETHLFFGREKHIENLIKRLSKTRFLAVMGSSGSGKSSVVLAGLLPALRAGIMKEAGANWKICIMRPGSTPMESLNKMLLPLMRSSTMENQIFSPEMHLETTLGRSSYGLVEAAEGMILEDGQSLLVVVDQFEEIFRYQSVSSTRDNALEFMRILMEATEQSQVPIYVLLTMRSDFLGDCSRFAGLPEKVNEGTYLIPTMVRDEFRRVITCPAKVGGQNISPALTIELLNNTSDAKDQLPILAHTLMRTWDYWQSDPAENGTIHLRHYEAIGGLENALDMHAEEIFQELEKVNLGRACEMTFKAITILSENRGVRHPTRLAEVAEFAGVPEQDIIQVAEAFRKPGRTFMVPPVGVPLTPDVILDISHESFMRVWKRLINWVEEEAESGVMFLRIQRAQSLHAKGRASLWRPPELNLAISWKENVQPTNVWAARHGGGLNLVLEFIRESRDAYEAELASLEAARKQKLRRSRIFTIALAIAALFSLGLGLVANNARAQAKKEAAKAQAAELAALNNLHEAERQKQLAVLEQIKADSLREIAVLERVRADRQRAKAEAQRIEADQQRMEAERQRTEANRQRKFAIQNKITADSNATMAVMNEKEAFRLRMLSLSQSIAIKSAELTGDERNLKAGLALQSYLLNSENGGADFNPDLHQALYETQKMLQGPGFNIERQHGAKIRSMALFPKSSFYVSASDNGKILMGDMLNGSTTYFQHKHAITNVKISSGKIKWLTFVDLSGGVYLANIGRNETPRKVAQFSGAIYAIDFSSANNSLGIVGSDGGVRVIDLNNISGFHRDFHLQNPVFNIGRKTRQIEFSQDGLTLFAISFSGDIIRFAMENGSNGNIIWSAEGDHGPASCLELDHSGDMAAVGTEKGAITLIDTRNGAEINHIEAHRQIVNAVRFDPKDKYLASASMDGSVRIFLLNDLTLPPIILWDNQDWMMDACFSGDGNFIGTACANGIVKAYSLNLSFLSSGICDRIEYQTLSQQEWNLYLPEVPYHKTCK